MKNECNPKRELLYKILWDSVGTNGKRILMITICTYLQTNTKREYPKLVLPMNQAAIVIQ